MYRLRGSGASLGFAPAAEGKTAVDFSSKARAGPATDLHAWGVTAKRGSRTLIHRQLLPQPPGGKHQNHPAEDFETVLSLSVSCARRFAFLL